MDTNFLKKHVLAVVNYQINYYDFKIADSCIYIINKNLKYHFYNIRTFVEKEDEYTIYLKNGKILILYDKELYNIIYKSYTGLSQS